MWRLWIDTGGTFTDCLGLDPEGVLHRAKVLSSSGLRGFVAERVDDDSLRVDWVLGDGLAPPADFFVGGRLRALGSGLRQRSSDESEIDSSGPRGAVRAPGHGLEQGDRVEARFDEEAPILAARLVTGAARVEDLPTLELRLATTRGTNALLERRGARTLFLVTKGFADLLRIGDQRRPDLFALRIDRPEPLYDRVIEVAERLAADGSEVTPLDLETLQAQIAGLRGDGFESAAVALLHSYLDDRHERRVGQVLSGHGFEHVSASAELSPSIRILPRAQTAVVDAYLSPVVGRYLGRVRQALGPGGARVRVMTSAGGLVAADRFRAKDSLLSGPAGGVVGAARVGRELGLKRLVAFDMGGTSTDVSRFDGDFEYRYEQRVGDAEIAAPSLAIETVAAGGGSVCGVDGLRLTVGPESAGASPGPACYGAGGPLTLTDVNLLLGRLDPERFGIPVDLTAAEEALDAVLEALRENVDSGRSSPSERDDLLRGFLEIADLRMAGAVRRISVRQGYDPRSYALVAFGGAGGQHACAVADELGISTAVLPREAGLLSALGLGSARIERFAQRQVLRRLDALGELGEFQVLLSELADEAMSELAAEGVAEGEGSVRRRIAFLRFAGQDATLEVDINADIHADVNVGVDVEADEDHLRRRLAEDFLEGYERRFGYRPEARPVEVESLRVVASTREESVQKDETSDPATQVGRWNDLDVAEPIGRRRACFDAWREVPVFEMSRLESGLRVDGPALVFDAHASLTLPPGWRAVRAEIGSLVAGRLATVRSDPESA